MRLVLLLTFMCFCRLCLGQESPGDSAVVLPPDKTEIRERHFDTQKLEEFREDPDLQYKSPATVAETLWDRLMEWIGDLIRSIFSGVVNTDWGNVFLYLLGIAVLTVIVMTLLKVNAFRVFTRGAEGGLARPAGITENIHEMNFERLLSEALEKKEFRLAIRLTFLHALKLLSDNQHLDWRPGKTNHDYLEELGRPELRKGFNELSFYFDYTWYGEFAVSEDLYQRVHGIFSELKERAK